MSGRDSDSEHTAVHGVGNGNGNGRDSDRSERAHVDLSGMSDRRLAERNYQLGVENEQRITLVYHALEAHRKDDARRWDQQRRTNGIVEGGILELVASDRARRDAETKARAEQGRVEAELRQSVSDVRKDLERKIADATRVSLVDEEERKIVHGMLQTSVEAARAHLGVRTTSRTKETELVTADAEEALQARKERRSLFVAGLKKIAPIAIPVLTAAAGAAIALLQKGC